jgi:adenine C2-methylase RlmN of 23S rRNA A2503 and tRNA A37
MRYGVLLLQVLPSLLALFLTPFKTSTGAIGFKRNMTTDEIVDQVLWFLQNGLPMQSISFMGMGEPLLNPSTFAAIDMLTRKVHV